MSGTFNDIDVPPTLVSFAVNVAKSQDVITPEFKKPGNKIVRICIPKDEYGLPDYEGAKKVYKRISKLMKQGKIVSAYAVGYGGTIEAVAKMAFGNRYGVKFDNEVCMQDLVEKSYGAIIVELGSHVIKEIGVPALLIGTVYSEPAFVFAGEVVSMTEAVDAWTGRLEGVFPTKTGIEETPLNTPMYREGRIYLAKNKVAKPKVFIPVFPGTNCEYDSLKAFERAGAEVETRIFKNLDAQGIRDSVDEFEKVINQSQIIMFPGGFSAGDEPEGSAKFFATAFRNEKLKEAVMNLLNQRDGLALGICNGFQALIKLGLVPYGEILEQTEAAPTLTMNRIGRHISQMVYTKIVTNKSPWLSETKVGDVHSIAVSHGEGRFVASEEVAQKLFENGQVATQYVDIHGNPTMSEPFNPNGSYYAIEGIISPDGRVLGKMGHSERIGDSVAINIQGNKDQKLFESGVNYFK